MKFPKDDLIELRYSNFDDYELISDELIDHSRWSLIYLLRFGYQEKYYQVSYRVGATESQDEGPFEYDDDMIECQEVKPVEKVVTEYVPV